MTKPSRLLLALEARAVGELAGFVAAAPTILPLLRRGGGRPVLVLPGFMAGDGSTKPLRWFLDRLGYVSYGWNVGRNIGPTDDVLDGLAERIEQVATEHDEPISIVGWSLGGVYAREMSRLAPEMIRDVVTLGSPFQMEEPRNSNAAPLHELLRAQYSDSVTLPRIPDHVRGELPVPSTAIFSRTDGIVNWSECIDVPAPRQENVEIYGSHCGLGHNPSALYVIGDRLAQRPDSWQPFRATCAFRGLFPDTSSLSAA